jgi:hypothetical protein
MKSFTVEIPRNGRSVHFVLRPGAFSGEVLIVVSDEVEIRDADSVSPPKASKVNASSSKLSPNDLDEILKRLKKSEPRSRTKALHFIKAMFNFRTDVGDDKVNEIFERLKKRGDLTIDGKGKLKIHEVFRK